MNIEIHPTQQQIDTWIEKHVPEKDMSTIQHAAYCIDDHLFFNKNGQTIFNPWKIVQWDELSEEWESYTTCIYRKSYKARGDSFGQ